jgi:hypothetical protein
LGLKQESKQHQGIGRILALAVSLTFHLASRHVIRTIKALAVSLAFHLASKHVIRTIKALAVSLTFHLLGKCQQLTSWSRNVETPCASSSANNLQATIWINLI